MAKGAGNVIPAMTQQASHAQYIGNSEDRKMKTLLTVSALVATLVSATGAGAQSDDRGWQLKRLFSPTSQDLAREAAGRVFIFDGLRDTDVERALQTEFERVGSMMFVRTVVTNRSGAPLQDKTDGYVTEDDDCD